MFEALRERGFQIEALSHAEAILSVDFPTASAELEQVLLNATIPIEEIVAGGGGEAKGTQRLRRGLQACGWETKEFTVVKTINGQPREAISHKVDHVKEFPSISHGASPCTLALEIEWNNKDPFYDRDLENFKRLHSDGAISVGIIITRGRSLHENMRNLVGRFFDDRQISNFEDLFRWGYDPTARQRTAITSRMKRERNPLTFREAFISKFVADKFGEATTHWRKLEDRVSRGVGNPCPLVLIGLPEIIVTFDEDVREIAPLINDAAKRAETDEAQE